MFIKGFFDYNDKAPSIGNNVDKITAIGSF